MKHDLTSPCKHCPWRLHSLQGWLGYNTPEDLAMGAKMGLRQPCHMTLDYEDPMWREKMEDPTSDVQQCAGALIAGRLEYVLPRDPILRYQSDKLTQDSIHEVMPIEDFLNHHNSAKVKSWLFEGDEGVVQQRSPDLTPGVVRHEEKGAPAKERK